MTLLSNQRVQKDSYCLYTQTDQLHDYDVAKHNQKKTFIVINRSSLLYSSSLLKDYFNNYLS